MAGDVTNDVFFQEDDGRLLGDVFDVGYRVEKHGAVFQVFGFVSRLRIYSLALLLAPPLLLLCTTLTVLLSHLLKLLIKY